MLYCVSSRGVALKNSILKSSVLLVSIKILQRVLGVISLLILARALSKEDFAVVAIVATVLFLFESLSALGTEAYIVQKDKIDSSDIHSAWTTELLLKLSCWGLLILLAPLISSYFKLVSPNVIYVSSLVLLLGAFKSPGIHLKKRCLDYSGIFRISVLQKFLSFSAVMCVVYIKPTFWALVVGDLVAALCFVVGSHIIAPYPFKLTLERFSEQWDFSKWVFLRGIVGYSKAQIDAFVAGRIFSHEQFGVYSLTKNVSQIPANDIVSPIIEPLLVTMARARNDVSIFSYVFSRSFFVISFLMAPITIFLTYYSGEVIALVLGPKWADAGPIFGWFLTGAAVIVYGQLLNQAFVALGQVKKIFIFEIISLAIMLSVFLTSSETLLSFVQSRAAALFLLFVCLLATFSWKNNVRFLRLFYISIPLYLSAYFAAFVGSSIMFLDVDMLLLSVMLDGLMFLLIYLVTLCIFFYFGMKNLYEVVFVFDFLTSIVRRKKNMTVSQ